jgi:hypothetical protein
MRKKDFQQNPTRLYGVQDKYSPLENSITAAVVSVLV